MARGSREPKHSLSIELPQTCITDFLRGIRDGDIGGGGLDDSKYR